MGAPNLDGGAKFGWGRQIYSWPRAPNATPLVSKGDGTSFKVTAHVVATSNVRRPTDNFWPPLGAIPVYATARRPHKSFGACDGLTNAKCIILGYLITK